MSRQFCLVFAVLTLASALPAGSAWAQNYPSAPPPPYRSGPPVYQQDYGPPPGFWSDDDDDDLPPRSRRQLPQYAPPDYQPGYQQGYQPGAANRVPPQAREADAMPPDARRPLTEGPDVVRPPAAIGVGPGNAPPQGAPQTTSALPPEDQPEIGEPKELPPELKRQLVDYPTKEPVGTVIIDSQHTQLYLTLGGGKAMRYGIGVGREGFTWAGTEKISRMAEWPDWHPPSEMIERQPYLPRFMAGGEGNPLGARALYLGKTLYRIHGTNQPSTIGKFVSSGCIRLLNGDIEDLFSRVHVGTRVVVLPGPPAPPATASNLPVPGATGAPMQVGPAGLPPEGAPNTAAIQSSPLPPVR